jgi:hypothetical protein
LRRRFLSSQENRMDVVYIHRVYASILEAFALTTELSGQARRPFRAGEHAVHGEHGAATVTAGPLQRVVSQHVHQGIIGTKPFLFNHPR